MYKSIAQFLALHEVAKFEQLVSVIEFANRSEPELMPEATVRRLMSSGELTTTLGGLVLTSLYGQDDQKLNIRPMYGFVEALEEDDILSLGIKPFTEDRLRRMFNEKQSQECGRTIYRLYTLLNEGKMLMENLEIDGKNVQAFFTNPNQENARQ